MQEGQASDAGPALQEQAPRTAQETLESLIKDFGGDAGAARRVIAETLEADPGGFFTASRAVLCAVEGTPKHKQFVDLLLSADSVLATLVDPRVLALDDCVSWATAVSAVEPLLDVKLIGLVSREEDDVVGRTRRVLEIVCTFSDGRRLLPFLMLLMRHPDDRVRSKAAMLIGRGNKDVGWVRRQLQDPDSRVRANAVESLWGQKSKAVLDLFRTASRDSHHRVVANALVGLHMAGAPGAGDELEQLATFPEPLVRAAAAWAMGFLALPDFRPTLKRLAGAPEPEVRRSALRALVRINKQAGGAAPAADPDSASP